MAYTERTMSNLTNVAASVTGTAGSAGSAQQGQIIKNDLFQETGGFGTAGQAFMSGVSISNSLNMIKNDKTRRDLMVELFRGSYEFISGDSSSGAARNLNNTRCIYAASQYQPAHGAGISHYSDFDYLNMISYVVEPNENTANMYKKYFDLYGYSSIRIGVPYIFNYINGQTGEQPHWVDNHTYVKCSDANVSCYISEVADWVKMALENGVVFEKVV